jgi:DNA repair protein RecO (recombination protein O)
MNWNDVGLILSTRKHGENSVIVHAFTRDHGRCAGLVRGGSGRRLRGILQVGNEVSLDWRGRLAEQLGQFTVEARFSHATQLFDSPLALMASGAALSLLDIALPEREPHPQLFAATLVLLSSLEQESPDWPLLLVRWELGLLGEIGYGLDLTCCAATGVSEDLVYVSPKSACAVSRDAGQPYHDKLLPLPEFLRQDRGAENEVTRQDILDGFTLTGYFVEKAAMEHRPGVQLSARERFIAAFKKRNLPMEGAISA